MVKELKKMLACDGISIEQYHYLFPKLMEGKYNLNNVSLFSYQLSLGWHPNFIYSGHTFSNNFDEDEQEFNQRTQTAKLAAFLKDSRPSQYNSLNLSDPQQRHQAVVFNAHLLFHCLRYNEYVFWSPQDTAEYFEDYEELDDYDLDYLQEYNRREIALKFAEKTSLDINGSSLPLETFLPELEEYLVPYSIEGQAQHPQKLRYYWTERNTNAFQDYGIIMVNESLDHLSYLVYINNY